MRLNSRVLPDEQTSAGALPQCKRIRFAAVRLPEWLRVNNDVCDQAEFD